MTISRTYAKTAGEIIAEALRDARIIPAEQPIQAPDYENGLTALNNVSAFWQTKGLHMWLMKRAILPMNVGQKSYALGPDGDPCGYEEGFVYTSLTADANSGDTTLAVDSTVGMEEAPDILESSPVLSTQDWTSINSATLAISSGLRITNVGATAGGATYELDATVGQTYRVRFTYTKGTSAGCTFSVLNSTTVADTITLTASGDGELEITAELTSITFKAQSASTVAGETSTVAALQYVDQETGSRIGIQLDDGTMQWTYVLNVDSTTSIDIVDALDDDAADTNIVYAFTDQIDRPLQLFNMTSASQAGQAEIPVNQWSRQEYMQQPNKEDQGTVVNWFYNPTLNEGVLYVWQTANLVGNICAFDVRRPLAIYNEINDELDLPVEYYQAMKWGIAADLGPSYGVPDNRQLVLESKAAAFLESAMDNDNELDSILIGPDYSGG